MGGLSIYFKTILGDAVDTIDFPYEILLTLDKDFARRYCPAHRFMLLEIDGTMDI